MRISRRQCGKNGAKLRHRTVLSMGDIVNILVFAAIGAVTIILGFGLYALFRGGDFGRSWSNRLMRLRVLLQAVALALLALGAWLASRNG
jgi:hypothetical protein